MLELALAFAYDRIGSHDRAIALADDARRIFDEAGDTWGVASSVVTAPSARSGKGTSSARLR
jgi:hypothetical protein